MSRIMRSEHQNGIVTGNGALTEQALHASELSCRRLFEAAQDGILILDVDTGRLGGAHFGSLALPLRAKTPNRVEIDHVPFTVQSPHVQILSRYATALNRMTVI